MITSMNGIKFYDKNVEFIIELNNNYNTYVLKTSCMY